MIRWNEWAISSGILLALIVAGLAVVNAPWLIAVIVFLCGAALILACVKGIVGSTLRPADYPED